jgi:hypothetical protein
MVEFPRLCGREQAAEDSLGGNASERFMVLILFSETRIPADTPDPKL